MASLVDLVSSTRVTFPGQAIRGESRVLYTQPHTPGRAVIFTEETPFHPISHSWPDQQADLGELNADGKTLPIVDVLTAAVCPATDPTRLYLDRDIPVRKVEPGWIFLVAHLVELSGEEAETLTGKTVVLQVDAGRRWAISATHTATHLTALALNKVTRSLWSKNPALDGLGNPDLDKLAMQQSTITPAGCTDHYRFGKSLRKQGFDAAAFLGGLADFSARLNQQIEAWRATSQPVRIDASGPALESQRWWVCELDGREVRFPCGGTHLTSLGQLVSVQATCEPVTGEAEIRIRTVATLQSDRHPLAVSSPPEGAKS